MYVTSLVASDECGEAGSVCTFLSCLCAEFPLRMQPALAVFFVFMYGFEFLYACVKTLLLSGPASELRALWVGVAYCDD